MIKKLIFIFCIIIPLSANESVYASTKSAPPSLEEQYKEIGYKSVEEAVEEFESHFKSKVKLPKVKPSISFTHQFGRFYEDKKYDMNDFLEIAYVNENLSENNYKIDIRPIKNKVNFQDKTNIKEYTLQSGHKAIYFEHQLLNFLVFEKDNYQYMLGIDKNLSGKVTPDNLVQIANSIK
ncbi:DUF4367 domain-containing protein [Cytobacillus firmus]|uniref:DUF4367 domain-containing protein n=1 Tax=Cytobacillus firmus TaxID=1399 RepID=UPI0018CEC2F9|nr:DUF4367 domain-containing protein [Cytobacillus firmus]MBG9550022.1 hypothetical protein [Cytobacillus firmus]MBG9604014.1 hypothetical protein [Cytobacillus firmus]MED1940807.1 DUF4367 domain-containing protein [Cytobacillus firmus]